MWQLTGTASDDQMHLSRGVIYLILWPILSQGTRLGTLIHKRHISLRVQQRTAGKGRGFERENAGRGYLDFLETSPSSP